MCIRDREVLDLCLLAIDATEAESKADGLSVAPWWYDQAALAARRSDQPAIERSVMERYIAHPSSKNSDYVEKFERFLAKLDEKATSGDHV